MGNTQAYAKDGALLPFPVGMGHGDKCLERGLSTMAPPRRRHARVRPILRLP
eukprot:gene21422-63320_t